MAYLSSVDVLHDGLKSWRAERDMIEFTVYCPTKQSAKPALVIEL